MNLNIEKAVLAYYNTFELGTGDIQKLFGCSAPTACDLKKRAQDFQLRKGEKLFSPRTCGTRTAFECWGYDIADLEERYAKIRKYAK